jgi:hypothetical protein
MGARILRPPNQAIGAQRAQQPVELSGIRRLSPTQSMLVQHAERKLQRQVELSPRLSRAPELVVGV